MPSDIFTPTALKQLDLPIIFGSLILFGILEVTFPFFQYKQNWTSRITTNFALGVTNAIFVRLVLAALYTWALTTPTRPALFHQSLLLNQVFTPNAIAVFSFLLLDVSAYGWHIMMHKIPIAWKFHRVHHCDLSMNISTAYRFHVLEVLASNVFIISLIWLFGIDLVPFLVYKVTFAFTEAFQHSNWALAPNVDKFVRFFIVTPNHHRVHHSQIVKETDSNYGSLLTIWDLLCGTFCYIRDTNKIDLGLEEAPKPLSLVDLWLLPFRGFKGY